MLIRGHQKNKKESKMKGIIRLLQEQHGTEGKETLEDLLRFAVQEEESGKEMINATVRDVMWKMAEGDDMEVLDVVEELAEMMMTNYMIIRIIQKWVEEHGELPPFMEELDNLIEGE